jgi:hypothetical protein
MGWATLEAAANRVALDRLGSVSVTAGAVTGRGFLNINSEVILGGEVTVIEHMLEVLTAEFGSLGYGDAITVGGESYKVEMQPQRVDTGMWCRIPLIKSAAATVANNITTLAGLRLVTLDGRYLVTLAS